MSDDFAPAGLWRTVTSASMNLGRQWAGSPEELAGEAARAQSALDDLKLRREGLVLRGRLSPESRSQLQAELARIDMLLEQVGTYSGRLEAEARGFASEAERDGERERACQRLAQLEGTAPAAAGTPPTEAA